MTSLKIALLSLIAIASITGCGPKNPEEVKVIAYESPTNSIGRGTTVIIGGGSSNTGIASPSPSPSTSVNNPTNRGACIPGDTVCTDSIK